MFRTELGEASHPEEHERERNDRGQSLQEKDGGLGGEGAIDADDDDEDEKRGLRAGVVGEGRPHEASRERSVVDSLVGCKNFGRFGLFGRLLKPLSDRGGRPEKSLEDHEDDVEGGHEDCENEGKHWCSRRMDQ